MENTISHDIIENRTISPIMKMEEDKSMEITATELKKNLGKYLELAETEDVLITKNGKIIARLVKPDDIETKLAALNEMIGIANPTGKPINISDDELKEMRINAGLEKYENLG